MSAADFPGIWGLIKSREAVISEVGIFWGQVTRTHLPEITGVVLNLPATLHLEGALDNIAYAQLLAGPGLQEAWQRKQLMLAWSRGRSRARRTRTAVSSFAIPDLALHWRGEREPPAAQRLGVEFASVLAEEFPDPVGEVLRIFNTDLASLSSQLAEADFQQAGTTLPRAP